MWDPYNSINHLNIIVLMGLRQSKFDGGFDTRIPFITETLKLPYKFLPQTYVLLHFFCSFLFEQNWDVRMVFSFYAIWFYLRFFMRTTNDPLIPGDKSPNFAFHTFFPERYQ